jgi:hypothetical protein
MADICVDLGILEPLLQILVDSLVADLADESQVANANFLLLGRFENCPLYRTFGA